MTTTHYSTPYLLKLLLMTCDKTQEHFTIKQELPDVTEAVHNGLQALPSRAFAPAATMAQVVKSRRQGWPSPLSPLAEGTTENLPFFLADQRHYGEPFAWKGNDLSARASCELWVDEATWPAATPQ